MIMFADPDISVPAESVVSRWGQKKSWGSGGTVSPSAGLRQSLGGAQREKPLEAQQFSQIQAA